MRKAPRMTFARYVCGWLVKDRIDRLVFPDFCTHIYPWMLPCAKFWKSACHGRGRARHRQATRTVVRETFFPSLTEQERKKNKNLRQGNCSSLVCRCTRPFCHLSHLVKCHAGGATALAIGSSGGFGGAEVLLFLARYGQAQNLFLPFPWHDLGERRTSIACLQDALRRLRCEITLVFRLSASAILHHSIKALCCPPFVCFIVALFSMLGLETRLEVGLSVHCS